MREMLETFRLPGESQQIARITEVFASTSTISMAIVGISERTTRRSEFAKARSTFLSTKSTLLFVVYLSQPWPT